MAHSQRIILDWTHHGRNVQKTQREKGIADNESTHCPYCTIDDDSQQHILCECTHPPIREIRDETLTKLESMITIQRNLTPEQQARKDYLTFLVTHMPTDWRGHRFWIGNLDTDAFSFLYHCAGSLRYAPVDAKDIREIHTILWDGVTRMMAYRNKQIRDAYRERKIHGPPAPSESRNIPLIENRIPYDYELYEGGDLDLAQEHLPPEPSPVPRPPRISRLRKRIIPKSNREGLADNRSSTGRPASTLEFDITEMLNTTTEMPLHHCRVHRLSTIPPQSKHPPRLHCHIQLTTATESVQRR